MIDVVEMPVNRDPIFGNVSSTLDDITYRLSDLCVLFENLGNIFLFLCVVDLGLSFLYVWNRHLNSHNRIRGMTSCLGVILFVLTIAHFAEIEAFRTDFYNAVNADHKLPYLVIQLSVAFDIILWVASVVVAAFAIHIKIISRQTTRLRNVS
jgi:phosphoglycerol transferase MdoB-like AlkP superfamily enzyme